MRHMTRIVAKGGVFFDSPKDAMHRAVRESRIYTLQFHFFFFKQKTAYEISSRDWSSDVCSSDLSSETKRETSRSSRRCASGMQSTPIFSTRLGMIETRLALPQRSPNPLIVPCTCSTPSLTAASELATAHSA